MRTALKTARGLGSAHTGAEHWWTQRLTALALIPLSLWFVVGVIVHIGADRAHVATWLANPVSAGLMILTLSVGLHHAQAGMRVVYEDYVHHEGLKLFAIVATQFAAYALALAGSVAVLVVARGV